MIRIDAPYAWFADLDGAPLNGGNIWIGEPGHDPITHPIAVYWDEAGTVPAYQPIQTLSGLPSRVGSPARMFVSETDYSMLVRDRTGATVYSLSSISELRPYSDIEYTLPATGAVTRLISSKLSEIVSVKDFGAVGNGVTDDYAAVQAAITHTATKKYGALYFPAGVYRLSARVTATLLADCGIEIYGDGAYSSILMSDNSVGCIRVTSASRASHFGVRDIQFLANNNDAGTALEYVGVPGGMNYTRIGEVRDVVVRAPGGTSSYSFNRCIAMTGLYRTRLNNVLCSAGYSSSTIMESVVDLSYCYAPEITSCYLLGRAEYGLKRIGTNEESILIHFSIFNGQDVGIYIKNDDPEPGAWVSHNHINAHVCGFRIDGLKYLTANNNLMYSSATTGADYTDWEVISGYGLEFRGNQYRGGLGLHRRHLDIKATVTPAALIEAVYFEDVGYFADTDVPPIRIGARALNAQVTLPYRIVTTDFVNYPAELYDVDDTAVDVHIHRGQNLITCGDSVADSPAFKLTKETASPAANDVVGTQAWESRDSAGALVNYASERCLILDPTAASLDGSWEQFCAVAGTLTKQIALHDGMTIGSPTAGYRGTGTINIEGKDKLFVSLNGGPGLYSGTGSPEGVVAANQGSIYIREDGAASTILYVKTTGPVYNTGWVEK